MNKSTSFGTIATCRVQLGLTQEAFAHFLRELTGIYFTQEAISQAEAASVIAEFLLERTAEARDAASIIAGKSKRLLINPNRADRKELEKKLATMAKEARNQS